MGTLIVSTIDIPLPSYQFSAERANLYIKGPGRARLMGNVVDLVCDVRWFTKKLVRFITVIGFTCPRRIDGCIDGDVGNVNALWPEFTSERLREYSLRRFSGSKSRRNWEFREGLRCFP